MKMLHNYEHEKIKEYHESRYFFFWNDECTPDPEGAIDSCISLTNTDTPSRDAIQSVLTAFARNRDAGQSIDG